MLMAEWQAGVQSRPSRLHFNVGYFTLALPPAGHVSRRRCGVQHSHWPGTHRTLPVCVSGWLPCSSQTHALAQQGASPFPSRPPGQGRSSAGRLSWGEERRHMNATSRTRTGLQISRDHLHLSFESSRSQSLSRQSTSQPLSICTRSHLRHLEAYKKDNSLRRSRQPRPLLYPIRLSVHSVKMASESQPDAALQAVMQALESLHKNPDGAVKHEANKWLQDFQQTPDAWQTANSLLLAQDLPIEPRLFAAQTFRTKVSPDTSIP